jgi:hypothetical protein
MYKSCVYKFVPMLVAVAVAYSALLIAAQPANADLGLFRARRTWWFSQGTPAGWDGREVWPKDAAVLTGMGGQMKTATTYPSKHRTVIVGASPFDEVLTSNPSFTIPYAHVKDTTYFWECPTPGPPPFDCYPGYLVAAYQYSYWNGAARFQKSHSQAAATTTTLRRRTIYDGGGYSASVPPTVYTPTVMYTLATPTEGGCKIGDPGVTHPRHCPGTTQFGGEYTTSRGGSAMITPGKNKFGGTLRWFGGPNGFAYQRISYFTPTWFMATGGYKPLSQQPTADLPKEIGYVSLQSYNKRFRLTNPAHQQVEILGDTAGNAACSGTAMDPATRVFPPITQQASPSRIPNSNTPTDAGCYYYIKIANYVRSGGPYTTGMVVNWDPNGTVSTKVTTTGYDNRTNMGVGGKISMVQPRLLHVYTTDPEIDPLTGESLLTWSSSRPRKMTFTFVPEPVGIAMLAAGFATLVGLHRLRRR